MDTRLGGLKSALSEISRAEVMDQFETVVSAPTIHPARAPLTMHRDGAVVMAHPANNMGEGFRGEGDGKVHFLGMCLLLRLLASALLTLPFALSKRRSK